MDRTKAFCCRSARPLETRFATAKTPPAPMDQKVLDRMFEGTVDFAHQLARVLGPACSQVHRCACLQQLRQSCVDAVGIADVYVATRRTIHAVMPHAIATSVTGTT